MASAKRGNDCKEEKRINCIYYRHYLTGNLEGSKTDLWGVLISIVSILVFASNGFEGKGAFASFFVLLSSNFVTVRAMRHTNKLASFIRKLIIWGIEIGLFISFLGIIDIIDVQDVELIVSKTAMYDAFPVFKIRYYFLFFIGVFIAEFVLWIINAVPNGNAQESLSD